MKELVEPVLRQLPTYLFQLFVRPKRSILAWVGESQGDLTRPLVFVCVTVGIGVLLQLPSLSKQPDVMTLIAGLAAFKVVAITLVGATIHGLFVLLRGKASFKETLSVYIYLISPLYLMLALLLVVSLGIVQAYDPALAAELRLDPLLFSAHPERAQAFESSAPGLGLAYRLVPVANLIVITAWCVACWGAFRLIHALPRWRSSIAGMLSAGLVVVIFNGLSILMAGVFGRSIPLIQ